MTTLQCVVQAELPPQAGNEENEYSLAPVITSRDSTASVDLVQPAPPLRDLVTIDEGQCSVDNSSYDDVDFPETIESRLSLEDNPYEEVNFG